MDVRTLQRGVRATRPRTWALWLTASLILHLPFTPLAGVLALLGLWAPSVEDDAPPMPALTEIPVDIADDVGEGQPIPPPAPASEPTPGEATEPLPTPKPKPKPKPKPILDAGVPDAAPDAGPEIADAGPSDAGLRDAGAPDASSPDAGPLGAPDAGAPAPGLRDPMADMAAVRAVSDPHANVRVTIDTEKLRSHRLGARIGGLLRGIYQWRDFLGPAGIDPVRDIDRIYIVGPELRRSANVTVLIQHRLGQEHMHEALDRLVQRDPAAGGWLEGKVPTASALADGSLRYFVQRGPSIVVVSPKETLESAQRFPLRTLPRLKGQIIAHAYLATPWRAVRGLPFRVPQSIEWASFDIEAREGGGAIVNIEAQDESIVSAGQHASELASAVLAATSLNLGVLGDLLGQRPRQFVQGVEFEASGSRILGKITVSEQQIQDALDLASVWLVPPPPRTSGTSNVSKGSAPVAPRVPASPPRAPSPAPLSSGSR